MLTHALNSANHGREENCLPLGIMHISKLGLFSFGEKVGVSLRAFSSLTCILLNDSYFPEYYIKTDWLCVIHLKQQESLEKVTVFKDKTITDKIIIKNAKMSTYQQHICTASGYLHWGAEELLLWQHNRQKLMVEGPHVHRPAKEIFDNE